MICTYLLFSGLCSSASEVLDFYGSRRYDQDLHHQFFIIINNCRTFDSNGVTIPSQRRYVEYFNYKISRELQYSPTKLLLHSVILEPPPHVGFSHHEVHLQFQVFQHFIEPFLSGVFSTTWEESKVVMNLKEPLPLSGDVKFVFSQKLNVDLLHLRNKPKFFSSVPCPKLFHFWINTFFVGKELSSDLSHGISQAQIRCQPLAQSHRSPKRNKSASSFTLRNRFAPLSMPDLATSEVDKESSEKEDGEMRQGTAVKLSKHQIDKVSKDHKDKFPEHFSVTLLVSTPSDEDNLNRSSETGLWMKVR